MSQHRVSIVGALGKMGVEVRAAVSGRDDCTVAGALEAIGHPRLGTTIENDVSVSSDAKSAFTDCDVAIDFSTPKATLANLRVASELDIAYVTGTTGFTPAELEEIVEIAKVIPVIHAPNFSVAVNVLAWAVREAAAKLGDSYDAEIVELHHKAKRDAPSGTALLLAEAVAAGQNVNLHENLVLERAGDTGARPDRAIGVQTLRGGDNTGEHTVMFVGKGERLELIHRSSTRAHFASGAVRAASWLVGKPAGLYPIEQVLGLE
ncbi:MAG: 4-hydroxy-tetrahydrodipicolinate reductase [Myxococcota bacterium]|nr:4-hydroxy-tetrahydrodipicolinate reductase [Myxococcota bacterium]